MSSKPIDSESRSAFVCAAAQTDRHAKFAASAPAGRAPGATLSNQFVPRVLGEAGRFSIESELGRGRVATVYRAHDRDRDRTVALKLLDRRALRKVGLGHVQREFAIASALRHRNLARHYELLSDAGEWFVTMELVEGRDFVEHVRCDLDQPGRRDGRASCTAFGQPVRLRGASEFKASTEHGLIRLRTALPQLVAAVHALHDARLVHCDLQPANVRVTYEGRVVVIDYGLAATASSAPTAGYDKPDGTLTYMAPEQWERSAAGPPSDWYAMGVILFEALTGGPPFSGDSEAMFMTKRTVSAPRPSQVVTAIPDDLDDLVAELLQIDPAQRPRGAELVRRFPSPNGPSRDE